MNSHTDITLINCNRTASVEARTKNNSNTAVFTNPLQQTLKLNVGDSVSVERSFISEVGAGNPQTIEFTGKSQGIHTVAPYTQILKEHYYYDKETTYKENYRLGNYRQITTNLIKDETVDLKDNEVPLIVGYYITSNEYPNYIQQPRSFAQSNDNDVVTPDNPTHYIHADSHSDGFNLHTVNDYCYLTNDWDRRPSQTGASIYKQKVDNSRFTMFIRDKIAYVRNLPLSYSQFPKKFINGIFSEATYYRIREKIDLSVTKGFNTPTSVAEQISNQLTETKTPEIFSVFDGDGYSRPITKLVETKTYKPINAQNMWNFNSFKFGIYRGLALPVTTGTPQEAVDYIATFGYIGVKRPEIFEEGRDMANTIVPTIPKYYNSDGAVITEHFAEGFEGFQLIASTFIIKDGTGERATGIIKTNIPYTKENLERIKKFLDTQTLYPECWEELTDSGAYRGLYKPSGGAVTSAMPTIKNSRFFHINRYTTDAAEVQHNFTLGDDGFTDGSVTNNDNKASLPFFFNYDDSPEQQNNFINISDYSQAHNGLIYGFCIPVMEEVYDALGTNQRFENFISFSSQGGIPERLYDRETDDAKFISSGRRIGFDFHATAYSTAIVTPYSGYSNCDIGTKVRVVTGATGATSDIMYPSTNNMLRNTISTNSGINISPYQTMTYVGANNPIVNYNGVNNRFEFSRLHTANNIGNKLNAGNKLNPINSKTMTPTASLSERDIAPPEINLDSGDTVYKISPRPPQFGYSPTFKPYTINNQSYRIAAYPNGPTEVHTDYASAAPTGMNTHFFEVGNTNIEPFSIFDSHGGIYIDNWGYSRDNWDNNLWDILGFEYDNVVALPTEKNVLTRRVNNDNRQLLYRPTTNAEIVSTDSKVYVANQYNANMYSTSLPYSQNVINYTTAVSTGSNYKFAGNNSIGQPLNIMPEISVQTQSISITATNLQKSVLKPYYTIRSSLLEGSSTIGGDPTGANLGIISVVDKYSAQGDYFFGNPSGLVFTITKPTMLSSITTSIHDPTGEYANVDDTSAVIYKVQKNVVTDTTILQELLEAGKKDKK